ncbi:DUF131 domain-containing protein [Pyrobaculum arsenaticum]|uniref:DUF131 domain-containing protein n=1 Tax=Pyrobaculum arsenaticum TaxID=121277 RepID=A0A7L4P9Z3_9CREN|nr:DUF131 domain-containing protein [Pyrobaculum arsenaticum]
MVLALLLIFAGFFLIVLALLLSALRGSGEEGRVEAGGVVLIGPVPIVFGTSERIARLMLILAVALAAMALLLFLLPLLR